jgi:hypothetical protein
LGPPTLLSLPLSEALAAATTSLKLFGMLLAPFSKFNKLVRAVAANAMMLKVCLIIRGNYTNSCIATNEIFSARQNMK